jgi:hypothetical protein
LRTLQSAVYQQLIHLLFNLNIRDAQAGLKLFRRNVLEDVLPLLTVKKFAFDLELLVVAQQLGYRSIVEAPIRLTAHFKRTVDPRTVLGILRDTIAIYYRLRISGYYARQRRRNQGPEDSETPPSELLGKRPSLRILILNWRCPRNPRGVGEAR